LSSSAGGGVRLTLANGINPGQPVAAFVDGQLQGLDRKPGGSIKYRKWVQKTPRISELRGRVSSS